MSAESGAEESSEVPASWFQSSASWLLAVLIAALVTALVVAAWLLWSPTLLVFALTVLAFGSIWMVLSPPRERRRL